MNHNVLVTTYFSDWIDTYKRGAVRSVTLRKYETSLKRLAEIAPELALHDLDRRAYQGILNHYARTHERQTTLDFHHHLRAAILDAVDDGLLGRDPTRRAVVKGLTRRRNTVKFLSLSELTQLLAVLDVSGGSPWDTAIYLIAKTGLRFAETLGLTPADINSGKRTLTVSKTWDYKSPRGGFVPPKNHSSVRTICLDGDTVAVLHHLIRDQPDDQTIFVHDGQRVFNDTVNRRLRRLCVIAGVPAITIHCLRHTHASVLLYAGVSVPSVARRLGHATIMTTQRTYLHIIQELEAQDTDKIIRCLDGLV